MILRGLLLHLCPQTRQKRHYSWSHLVLQMKQTNNLLEPTSHGFPTTRKTKLPLASNLQRMPMACFILQMRWKSNFRLPVHSHSNLTKWQFLVTNVKFYILRELLAHSCNSHINLGCIIYSRQWWSVLSLLGQKGCWSLEGAWWPPIITYMHVVKPVWSVVNNFLIHLVFKFAQILFFKEPLRMVSWLPIICLSVVTNIVSIYIIINTVK